MFFESASTSLAASCPCAQGLQQAWPFAPWAWQGIFPSSDRLPWWRICDGYYAVNEMDGWMMWRPCSGFCAPEYRDLVNLFINAWKIKWSSVCFYLGFHGASSWEIQFICWLPAWYPTSTWGGRAVPIKTRQQIMTSRLLWTRKPASSSTPHRVQAWEKVWSYTSV